MAREGIPKLPSGQTPKFFFMRCLWFAIWGGKFPFQDTDTVKCIFENGYYGFKAAPQNNGGGSGWFWRKGSRLYGDPAKNSYQENQVVKILETDSIVTAGIVCAGSATPVKAQPGKWVATRNVKSLKNDGTDNPALIPQIPQLSGSLDPDNAGNFWELITPSSVCLDDGPKPV